MDKAVSELISHRDTIALESSIEIRRMPYLVLIAFVGDFAVAENVNMDTPVSQASLMDHIADRLQAVIDEAEANTKPLEMDPYRSQLFELFVLANGAGLTDEELEPNLTSDSVARILAERWGLRQEVTSSAAAEKAISSDGVAKMRLLWSLLRMWMEWCYAWDRWQEFHEEDAASSPR